MNRPYQICTHCVMDTTDPNIQFDGQGVCNHCRAYGRALKRYVLTGEAGQRKIQEIVGQIKKAGSNKQYDCVIGVSGGVDSTFVAYTVKQLGLRPLAVHLDNGWDSELAVKNIEQTLKKLGIDLYTEVLDWEEFKDLQLSFLKASTPDSEIPSDHAIVACLRHTAHKIGVRYVIFGNNVRTESHLPHAWSQGHMDWKYISEVQKQFGTVVLRTFPHMDFWTQVYYRLTQTQVDLLNYMDYSKKDTIPILEREIGWRYYGGKHHESLYTRWYQGHWLPQKFGYDKRRHHLSSLICSGEMAREEALEALKIPPYSPALQEEDTAYVIKKFGLTDEEYEQLMNLPKKSYWDYPSYSRSYPGKAYRGLRAIYRGLRELTRS
jgi:N-acetyl sugar amidotransferase